MNIKRLCRICGEKPPLHKHNEMCPSCMSKKSWEKRKNKSKPSDVPKKKPNTKGVTYDKEKQEKSVLRQNTAITIEFEGHAAILREVEKLSVQELRPVDMQIIYMLKKQLLAFQQSP